MNKNKIKEIQEYSIEKLRELIKNERESLDKFELATVIIELGKKGDISDNKIILEFINHPDDRVRANAIEAIEYLGDKQTIDVLTEFLNDTSNRVRTNVIKFMLNNIEFNDEFLIKEYVKCPECGSNLICPKCNNIDIEINNTENTFSENITSKTITNNKPDENLELPINKEESLDNENNNSENNDEKDKIEDDIINEAENLLKNIQD